MELKLYLQNLRTWWWLFAIPIVSIVGLTVLLTSEGPPRFRSTGTFLVQPRVATDDEGLRATDYLIRTDGVAPTVGEIATSEEVRSRVEATLANNGTDVNRFDDIVLRSRVLAGTTIVTLTAEGSDAQLTRDFLRQTGTEAVHYLASLNHLFTIVPLDEPSLAKQPLPSKRPITLAGAGVLGLLLGGVAVFTAEYLRQPFSRSKSFDVVDPRTGLHNEAFFDLRFDQELSRCRRNGSRFTVATARVERLSEDGDPLALRNRDVKLVAQLLALMSRPEDILAHVGDGTVMVLLPDTDQEEAEHMTTAWCRQLWPATDGVPPPMAPFQLRIGLCQYGNPPIGGDGTNELAART